MRFYLYRLKVIETDQDFLPTNEQLKNADGSLNRTRIINDAISEFNPVEVRKGQTWVIGNLRLIGLEVLAFAFGKLTRATHESYNRETHRFTAAEHDEAHRAEIVLDKTLQVCAISPPPSSSSLNHKSIAKNLEHVLGKSKVAQECHCHFNIDLIRDKRAFITRMREANHIIKVTFYLSRPNPPDANELYHEPLKRLMGDLKATKGSCTLNGESIDLRTLEAMTESVSNAGDKVRATIELPNGEKPTITTDDNPSSFDIGDNASDDNIIQQMRHEYDGDKSDGGS